MYGDTAEGPSQSAYEGRYTTHAKSALVYTKTVTAAGLTVDLPSPDSGIGADAITPRDQNNIQQVRIKLFVEEYWAISLEYGIGYRASAYSYGAATVSWARLRQKMKSAQPES